MGTREYEFTNANDARKFVYSIGGPISIDVKNPKRGQWIVLVTPWDETAEEREVVQ